MIRFRLLGCLLCTLTFVWNTAIAQVTQDNQEAGNALVLVVMDPLAAPLACDCVKGYAQRKYELLAKHLEKKLGSPINVFWAESLKTALKDSEGRVDIIVGKHSVVLADAAAAKIEVQALAQLSGKNGDLTQHGLIVVRKGDAAKTLSDLAGYEILFGSEECDEKFAAPLKLLADNSVAISDSRKCFGACSTAATTLIEMEPDSKAAAVISSYAKPLLEGCGTIQKGDLRIVAETGPVKFVSAFAATSLGSKRLEAIRFALLDVKNDTDLLKGLETKNGFVAIAADSSETNPETTARISQPTAKKKN